MYFFIHSVIFIDIYLHTHIYIYVNRIICIYIYLYACKALLKSWITGHLEYWGIILVIMARVSHPMSSHCHGWWPEGVCILHFKVKLVSFNFSISLCMQINLLNMGEICSHRCVFVFFLAWGHWGGLSWLCDTHEILGDIPTVTIWFHMEIGISIDVQGLSRVTVHWGRATWTLSFWNVSFHGEIDAVSRFFICQCLLCVMQWSYKKWPVFGADSIA